MAIKFQKGFEFEYARAAKLSPLIHRVVANNPGPFTYMGTGTYIIGTDRVAVIDPGPDDDAHFDALIAALDGKTVDHILITHTHRDHSPLAARLKQHTGARTYGYGPHGTGAATAASTGDVRLDAAGDHDFVPDQAVAHGDIIEGDGWRIECVFTPGHTSNHMCFALMDEKTLFSGDHVMGWSTSVIAPPDGHMGDYMASLNLLRDRDDVLYWPTHGPAITKPQAFVRAFIGHRKARETAILAELRRGVRKIPDIVKKLYAEVDPRLHRAAAMSVLAHMQHLIEQGRVKCADGAAASVDADYLAVT